MDPSALDKKKKTDFLVEFPDHFAIGSHVYLGLTGCTDTLTPNNLLNVYIATSWLHGWDTHVSSGLFQRTNISTAETGASHSAG